MAAKQVPIYRLPRTPKQHVGHISVKKDRNGKIYISGVRVEEITTSGDFQILSMGDGRSYYVLASELARV